MIGTQVGHYRIERLLGSGGMGEVYLAHDSRLGREVALKVLSTELASDPDRRERFEREARAAAALNHPNIVTIHSVEEANGVPFLTLEVVDGQTLTELIPPAGLPLERLLTLAIPLADAVGAAHQRGITHRDLKPANVMVTSEGRVKVLDFGLAKVKEEVRQAAEAEMPTVPLTGDGRIVGTVAYMSPEQAEGRTVDQRSDVFSLGVILYEMSTGQRPFAGDTPMSILSSIIKDTPKSIADLRPGLPRELSKIVSRCLAKDVEDRYQSAKDLRNDLRALKNDLTSGEIVPITASGERAVVGRPRSRALFATGAVLLLAAIGGVGYWLFAADTSSAPAARPFDEIKLTRLTTNGAAGLASMSLDGRYVAHVSTKGGMQSLWLRQVATTSNVEVVPPANVRYIGVTFSPDGNHIYYATYPRGSFLGSLYQVPVLGGGARLILEDVDTPVAFSPDGRQFAFTRGAPDEGKSAIVVANADGSGLRQLAVRQRPLQFSLPGGVSWSKDGKLIAATGSQDEEVREQVVIVDVANGKESVLQTPEWRGVTRVGWMPGGDGLLVNAQESAGESSNQIFYVPYPSGAARRLTNDLTSYSGLSVGPDGSEFVAIRNERRATIWTMAMGAAGEGAPITVDAAADEGSQGIAFAPDGRLVYTTEASGNPDIWIMNADGSRRVQLTSNPGLDVAPRVTADGRYIVFASDRDGAVRPWRMALDGSGATRLSQEVLFRWRAIPSPDGKWAYYDDTKGGVRKVPIEGGDAQPALPPDVIGRLSEPVPPNFHEAMLSPDGTMLAAHYTEKMDSERIMIVPLAGGALRRYVNAAPPMVWGADSRSIVYFDFASGASNVMRQALSGGPPTSVARAPDQIFAFALSPDQKHMALVRGRVSSDVVLVSTAKPQ
jgi:eukaryotic-like serine/threonine-protein kinase